MDVLAKNLFSARFHPAAPRIPSVLAGIYYAAPSAQPLYNYMYEPLDGSPQHNCNYELHAFSPSGAQRRMEVSPWQRTTN